MAKLIVIRWVLLFDFYWGTRVYIAIRYYTLKQVEPQAFDASMRSDGVDYKHRHHAIMFLLCCFGCSAIKSLKDKANESLIRYDLNSEFKMK